ncbi:hypothetical protein Tco_1342089, partial [Tanacetum coccineum]
CGGGVTVVLAVVGQQVMVVASGGE